MGSHQYGHASAVPSYLRRSGGQTSARRARACSWRGAAPTELAPWYEMEASGSREASEFAEACLPIAKGLDDMRSVAGWLRARAGVAA